MDIQKHPSVMKDCDEGKTILGHNGPERFVYALADIGSIIEHQELVLWSSIFVTLMANKIGGLQFGIYRNCQISSRVFHTAVAALPLTKANRSDFE